jgi:hypothetical protein
MHILGLGFDESAGPLRRLVARLRAARDERNPRIVAALQSLGFPIDMDDVIAAASSMAILAMRSTGILPVHPDVSCRGKMPMPLAERTIGRVHIAEALRRKGCVSTIAEAFERLIGHGRPAYVDKERIDPPEVIRAIADSGGAAVLAHPPQLLYENLAQLERIVKGLAGHGLAAIEAYHSDHTPGQTRQYMKLAGKLHIGVTGGSDFHGAAKPDARLGRPPVPLAVIDGRLRRIVMGEQEPE